MSFDNYERQGAYHWLETNRRFCEFNPPLVARYNGILDRIDSGSVLDIAAGDGYLSAKLAESSQQLLAVEVEPEGARIAKEMFVDCSIASVFRDDSYQLPFNHRSLDQIMMADVIEHLEDAACVRREVSRVLKVNGQLLLTISMWRADRMWDQCHVKEYRPEEMSDLLSRDFDSLSFGYFWLLAWPNFYSTKVGWRVLKWLGRFGFNPFMHSSINPEGFGKMLVVATLPKLIPGGGQASEQLDRRV